MTKGYSSDSFLMIHHGLLHKAGDLRLAAVLAVLRAKRDWLGKTGKLAPDLWFYMHQPWIAQKFGISRYQSVPEWIKKLEEMGLVETKHIHTQQGNRVWYRLNDSKFHQICEEGNAELCNAVTQDDLSISDPAWDDSVPTESVGAYPRKAWDAVISSSTRLVRSFAGASERRAGSENQPNRLDGNESPVQELSVVQPAHRRMELLLPSHIKPKPSVKLKTERGFHLPKRRERAVYNEDVPAADRPILDWWCANIVAHKPGTKTYADSITALRKIRLGGFFTGKPGLETQVRPFSQRSVLGAMEKLKTMLTDTRYAPLDKPKFRQGLRLPTFFFNQFAHQNGNQFSQSLFLRCIYEDLRLLRDHDPELTDTCRRLWTKETGGKLHREDAVQVAARVGKFWSDNKRWCQHHSIDNPQQLAVKWFKSAARKGKVRVVDLVAAYAERNFMDYAKSML